VLQIRDDFVPDISAYFETFMLVSVVSIGIRNKPKKIVFSFAKQTEKEPKQTEFRFVSVCFGSNRRMILIVSRTPYLLLYAIINIRQEQFYPNQILLKM
jgi:hypothetical protein